MAKIYSGTDRKIIRFLQTTEDEVRFGAPADFSELIEFDPDTNNEVIIALNTDWNSHSVESGKLIRNGVEVAINPPGIAYEDGLRQVSGKTTFRTLPEWATWTPDEGKAQIQARVLSGQTKAQVDAWIDANTTGTTVAALKPQIIAALKLLGGGIVALREIVAVMGYAVLLLRDVVIRRTG